MIGLVLVTHGQLAEEFRNAVEHVVGPQEKFETVAIGADDDMEVRRQDIVEAVARADSGAGVVILTDMFGGTPSNLAISVMEAGAGRGYCGHEPADAHQAFQRALRRQYEHGAERGTGGRTQIHQRGQPVVEQQMTGRVDGHQTFVRDFEIVNQRGLHARASAKFVSLVSGFNALVNVEKDGVTVGGTSIMGLMMLAASLGCRIRVSSSGPEAAE